MTAPGEPHRGARALAFVAALCLLAGGASAQSPRRTASARRPAAHAPARLDASVAPAHDDPLRLLLTRGVAIAADSQPARYPLLGWVEPGDTVIRTTLPPGLESAIQAAVPSWRLRHPGPAAIRDVEGAMALPTPGFPLATIDAAVADLDRDGRLDAVLVGYEMARARPLADSIHHPTEPAGPDGLAPRVGPGRMLPVVVLGVRTRRGADGTVRWDVTPLLRDSSAVYGAIELPSETPSILRPFVTVDARGQQPANILRVRTALHRAHRFVRYRDDDCFADGGQWTIRAGRWVRVPAVCTYYD